MFGNPALNDNTFDRDVDRYRPGGLRDSAEARTDLMTVQGTVFKTGVLLGLVFVAGAFTWQMMMEQMAVAPELRTSSMPQILTFGGAIGGFIVALVTIFKQAWAPITAPIYALLQGLFLGGISAMFASQFEGIVPQAIGLTGAVTAAMLILYTFRIIKVTEKLRSGIIMAVCGVMLFYVATIVLGLFGVDTGSVTGNGPLSIGISLVIVGIASASLLLDFDFIERGAEAGAPKHMEWYGAFGLMVTLVWLYLELLKLLSKFQSRD